AREKAGPATYIFSYWRMASNSPQSSALPDPCHLLLNNCRKGSGRAPATMSKKLSEVVLYGRKKPFYSEGSSTENLQTTGCLVDRPAGGPRRLSIGGAGR